MKLHCEMCKKGVVNDFKWNMLKSGKLCNRVASVVEFQKDLTSKNEFCANLFFRYQLFWHRNGLQKFAKSWRLEVDRFHPPRQGIPEMNYSKLQSWINCHAQNCYFFIK